MQRNGKYYGRVELSDTKEWEFATVTLKFHFLLLSVEESVARVVPVNV